MLHSSATQRKREACMVAVALLRGAGSRLLFVTGGLTQVRAGRAHLTGTCVQKMNLQAPARKSGNFKKDT